MTVQPAEPEGHWPGRPVSHGTYVAGCRCDGCRDARRVYARAYYAANRERLAAYSRARYHARRADS